MSNRRIPWIFLLLLTTSLSRSESPRFWMMAKERASVPKHVDVFTGGVDGYFAYTNECQLAEIVEDGRSGLLINMRNHWGRGGFPEKSGKRLVARSFDGGASWGSELMDAALPEPPCQASLYRYSFASHGEPSRLLFANPIGPARANLRVRLSFDEGKTWPHGKLIAVGPAPQRG